jgi:hypothetical protein
MKTSILQQNEIPFSVVELVQRMVARIPWPDRRQAMADATMTLLEGKPRVAEAVFGWGRATVELGMHELQSGIVCLNDLSNRRKPKTEEKYPQLLDELRAITEADSQAQSHLRTDFTYTNMTATSVRSALLEKGWPEGTIPTVRTLSNILNRQNYKLRRVTKTQVEKKRKIPTRSSRM